VIDARACCAGAVFRAGSSTGSDGEESEVAATAVFHVTVKVRAIWMRRVKRHTYTHTPHTHTYKFTQDDTGTKNTCPTHVHSHTHMHNTIHTVLRLQDRTYFFRANGVDDAIAWLAALRLVVPIAQLCAAEPLL
jgi:hypothetical protein